MTLRGLQPGILYKIVVESVVSVKTTLDSQERDDERDDAMTSQNRRTTHVMSKPLFVRTKAPCEKPVVYVTGYSDDKIHLAWERPKLYSVIGQDDSGNPHYLKHSLEGYRLEINGRPHMRLRENAQSCTLVKCRAGKSYRVELVACTCTEQAKKERKQKAKKGGNSGRLDASLAEAAAPQRDWEVTPDDLENDESRSDPIDVTLPSARDGAITTLMTSHVRAQKTTSSEQDGAHDFGDIRVEWQVHGDEQQVLHFLVTSRQADGSTETNIVSKESRSYIVTPQHDRSSTHPTQRLPINTTFNLHSHRCRCLYDISVTAEFKSGTAKSKQQHVQCLVPGRPDAPEIWTRSVGNTEFVIEWAEPRLFGVKVRGYQMYINDKKVGNALGSHHRKAVIPCKPKR